MPQQKVYEFTDPATGFTIEVEGPAPPPEAVLRQMFTQAQKTQPPPIQSEPSTVSSTQPFLLDPNRFAPAAAAHGIIGAAKGVGNTAFGLVKMMRDYTPIGRVSDAIAPGAFDQRPAILEPSNPQQRTGYAVEQIGEFFLPTGIAGKAAKIGEVAKAAGLTLAQSGSPGAAGTSAALTAVIPQGRTLQKVSGALSESAEKGVAQALGATKEWAKDKAATLAPEMLARGVRGTRTAMLERAASQSKAAGQKLGALYTKAAEEGATISGPVIVGELQFAKDGLLTKAASGEMIPIPGAERVLQKLGDLESFVAQLGDDIPVDQAHRIKTAWDKIVSKAGLYGPKATATATDSADAWALREGAGAIRTLLNDVNPNIAALNREYAFWKGLKDVLKETRRRTQAQGGGLQAGIAAASGGGAGFASGGLAGAFAGATGARTLVRLLQSPWWRTSVSAPLKQQLASALAAGNQAQAASVVSRMLAALPAQARTAFAQ